MSYVNSILDAMKPSKTLPGGPGRDQAYKGHLIKYNNMRDEYHVSKDGYHITTQKNLDAAKRQIDALTESDLYPHADLSADKLQTLYVKTRAEQDKHYSASPPDNEKRRSSVKGHDVSGSLLRQTKRAISETRCEIAQAEKTRRLLDAIPAMVSVIDHVALRFFAICLATSCKNAVVCSMSLGDVLAEPNMLAGFVSTERSMSTAFSNVAT
jgi:hypothetical protein